MCEPSKYTVAQICRNYVDWSGGPDYGNHNRFLVKLADSDLGDISASELTSELVYAWSMEWNKPSRLIALQMVKRAWNYAAKPTTLQKYEIEYRRKRNGLNGKEPLNGVLSPYDNPLYEVQLNYQNYKDYANNGRDKFFEKVELQCIGLSEQQWDKRQRLKELTVAK